MMMNSAAALPVPLIPGKRGKRNCVCHGTFLSMQKTSGWIRPIEDIDHPASQDNWGDVYLSARDVCPGVTLEAGDSVVFYLYADSKGLGAECCAQVWHPQGQAMRRSKEVAFHAPVPIASPAMNLPVFFNGFAEDDFDDSDDEDGVSADRTKIRLSDILAEPVSASATPPSVGSVGHAEGTCKRCSFFPKGTCLNGSECEFCHYSHEKRPNRKRQSRKAKKTQTHINKAPMKCQISEYLLSVSKGVSAELFGTRAPGDSTPTTSDGEGVASLSDVSFRCGTPPALHREPIVAPPGLTPPPPDFPPPPPPASECLA